MNIGVYPGSFDPLTSGHMDVLRRAAALMDRVVVGVLINTSKTPFFSIEERIAFIKEAIDAEGIKNAEATHFDGLLVAFAQKVGARHIVRGLRAVMDFEYEFSISSMNKRLAPGIDTVYFMAEPEHSYLSASIVREVGGFGGSIDGLVPDVNKSKIIERLS
ncbi:MAG: pantetheine-phosphate adenylyltransferase [Clostridiales bacterium]|jgi:pantetheine-phosphate adenylyltransferase|nr:pantetheine-phosphate adenylyltransferase [Clostridiales bacterium]